MRVAVVHNQPSGGARRALAGFCARLRRAHELDVFTLSSADDEWIPDALLGRPVARLSYACRRPIRRGLWLNDIRRTRDAEDLDAVYRTMAVAVDKGGYHVVLVDVCQHSLVPSVLRHLRTPSAYYAHNGPAALEDDAWAPSHTRYEVFRDRWHAPLVRRLEQRKAADQRAAIGAAGVVLANSVHTAERVRAAWGRDAVVCPPGVDVPRVYTPPDRIGVLSVGELEPRKGFDFLVDALGLVPADFRPPLRICANRQNALTRSRLEEQARRRGVELTIEVDPPQDRLWQAYEEAALFVYGARREALGLAPLEAMARGRPVVAVAEGGVVETVVHGGTGLLTARNPAEFAEAVTMVVRDGAFRRSLAVHARQHVERSWSWRVRAGALEAALEAVAASRGAP